MSARVAQCGLWWNARKRSRISPHDNGKAGKPTSNLIADHEQQASAVHEFPLDLAKLVASAVVERSREAGKLREMPSWNEVIKLQPGIFDEDIDLQSEVEQIIPFLQQNLSVDLQHLVKSTAYPFLSRHLSNSFGIWELPLTPESENLGSAMHPSASYFNHSCDPNVSKVRQGRTVLFVTSRNVRVGEELCISYGHTERPLEERRNELKRWWGFVCDCPRCLHELGLLDP